MVSSVTQPEPYLRNPPHHFFLTKHGDQEPSTMNQIIKKSLKNERHNLNVFDIFAVQSSPPIVHHEIKNQSPKELQILMSYHAKVKLKVSENNGTNSIVRIGLRGRVRKEVGYRDAHHLKMYIDTSKPNEYYTGLRRQRPSLKISIPLLSVFFSFF